MHNPAREADFVPPALIHGGVPRPRESCSRFALSFFTSVEAARQKYRRLGDRVNVEEKYGGYIGEIKILEGDGLVSDLSKNGHMDLHENEGSTFKERVANYSPAATSNHSD
jgi:hypothetical protein